MNPVMEEIWKQCHRHRQHGLEPRAVYLSLDKLDDLLKAQEDGAVYHGEYIRRNTIFGLKVFTVDRIENHVYVAGELR